MSPKDFTNNGDDDKHSDSGASESGSDDDSTNGGELVLNFDQTRAAIVALLQLQGGFSQSIATFLKKMKAVDVRKTIRGLIDTFTDKEFQKRMLRALGAYIKNHPYKTAFFLISILLILNPLVLAGFGASGPIAGSLAAGWQATMGGYVAAGSVFAVLQSWGMLGVGAVVLPMIGVSTIIGVVEGQHIKNAFLALTKWVGRKCGARIAAVGRWWNTGFCSSFKNWIGNIFQREKGHEHND